MLRRHKWIAHNPGGHEKRQGFSSFLGSLLDLGALGTNRQEIPWNHAGTWASCRTFTIPDLGLAVRPPSDGHQRNWTFDLNHQRHRPEFFMGTLPQKPELLTMTVDVQGSGFWWSIRAWGIMFDHPELKTWSATIDCGSAVSWEQIEELAGLTPKANGKYHEYI